MVDNAKLKELNDLLRTKGEGGKVVCTNSVKESKDHTAIIQAVKDFNEFTDANDPWDEHDGGFVTVNGRDFMFKIDYYDKDYKYLSSDTADNSKTNRVLTIMCASEY